MIVDPLPAARFIARQFGWASPTSMTLAGDGAMGRIWRLETGTGSYAVKELYWATDVNAEELSVARQVRFCEKARAAGVSAPENLRTESGHHVISVPQSLGGRLIRAYEWIDGRPITRADATGAAWAGQTEAIIEGLNELPGDQELDPWSYLAPSAEAWHVLADRCDAAHEPWADSLRRTIPKFVALAESLRPPDLSELIVTHTDFQRQNVFVETSGRYVLLDWDDAGPSTRSRALGSLLNNWHIDGTAVDHEGIRQMLTAYRALGGTGQITEVADLGDAFCGYLNYVHAQAGLSLDHAQPAVLRAEASQRLPELLNPPPLATYEEAVRAAASY